MTAASSAGLVLRTLISAPPDVPALTAGSREISAAERAVELLRTPGRLALSRRCSLAVFKRSVASEALCQCLRLALIQVSGFSGDFSIVFKMILNLTCCGACVILSRTSWQTPWSSIHLSALVCPVDQGGRGLSWNAEALMPLSDGLDGGRRLLCELIPSSLGDAVVRKHASSATECGQVNMIFAMREGRAGRYRKP